MKKLRAFVGEFKLAGMRSLKSLTFGAASHQPGNGLNTPLDHEFHAHDRVCEGDEIK